ncbi:hypothetical protein [Streptomyces caniscabiei]|uniref:hypothetical protein n=1 Tax=Streptomyces caniscabiei TaxID=2746961 RepID=UPI00076587E3|nr:hypothetical protein [Streptomyces caniscabiei]
MSTRNEAVEMIRRICPPHLDRDEYGRILAEKFDTHRTQVLAKAIGRLRAIPVDCTALTGPVWYGDGWNSAITCLEEIAEYQTPDDEAYPGELQRLRALALGLRVAALRKEDLAEAQRLLTVHAEHETNAREKGVTETEAPDFFQRDRTYTSVGAGGVGLRFVCEHVTVDPKAGDREAWGWLLRANGTRRMLRVWDDDWPQWTATEAGETA